MEAFNMQLLRIFDWLLWTTIQGSVLIVLIVLLQVILHRRLPVRWHYLLWVLLLVRLAVPWLPESKMSIFNLVPRSIQQGRIIESFSQSRRADPMDSYMYGRFASATQKTDESETVSVEFVRALPVLWLVGTVLIAGYIFMRSIGLWWIVKRERPITDSEILDLLEDCKMQMGVQTIIGVVVSDRIKSPALFGFIRPRLLLPQGMLETFSHEELRYVFIYELAHLKQRDIYLGWLITLLHVVHWFNPLMWFAFGRIRADREMACDTLAISMMGPDESPKYGRTIVSLLEGFSQVRYLPSVAGILEDTCQVERRIKMITDYKKTSRTRWAGAVLLVVVLACVVLTNAYVAKADFTFGEPMNLGQPVNSSAGDIVDCFSADGLEMYFDSQRRCGRKNWEIWVSRRSTIDDEWGTPTPLEAPVNVGQYDCGANISPNGLELYFISKRSGGYGQSDIWVAKRPTINDPWNQAVNLGSSINTSAWDGTPCLSNDGLELYFDSDRSGGYGSSDIWVVTRSSLEDPWGEPMNLGPTVNSSALECAACISDDGLLLFFSEDYGGPKRPGGFGHADVWVSKRASITSPWGVPLNLGPLVNSPSCDIGPKISPDGFSLYFTSERLGSEGRPYGECAKLNCCESAGQSSLVKG